MVLIVPQTGIFPPCVLQVPNGHILNCYSNAIIVGNFRSIPAGRGQPFFFFRCFTVREWRELFIEYSIESETLGRKRGAANLRWGGGGARSAPFCMLAFNLKRRVPARARSAAKTHQFIIGLALRSVSCQFESVIWCLTLSFGFLDFLHIARHYRKGQSYLCVY